MGYKYYYLLSLDNTGEIDNKTIETLWENKFVEVYNKFKDMPQFPLLGIDHRSSSGGCGTGPIDQQIKAFKMFTSQFPQFTFGLWLFYFDNTRLISYKIKDKCILEKNEYNSESIFVGASKLYVEMDMISTNISNNITGLLNPQYIEKTGYEVTYGEL